MWSILVALACTKPPEASGPAPEVPAPPPSFDAEAPAIACAAGSPAPLLELAAQDAGLTVAEIGYDEARWQGASYRDVLDDPFLLPWYREAHWAPLEVPCLGGQLAADLDHAGAQPHPVATALGEAMDRLGVTPAAAPIDPATATQELVDLSELPPDLAAALTPILAAMVLVADAREVVRDAAPDDAPDLVEHGHGGGIVDVTVLPDLTDPDVQDWILRPERGPRGLYDPARVLAFAVEHADLARFAGLEVTFDSASELGRVIVAGPGADEPGDIGEVALYLDLGGDDVYTHPTGANSVRVPAAVHVDLGGDDTYTYVATDEGDEHLRPSDAGGRYPGDAYYGPFSLSTVGRQGSGRFGVGMSFDLGGGNDRYESLRMSQGWGHLGVGVLYDDAGKDTYLGEAGVQGAAAMGIGLFLDGAGEDYHETFTSSQGFGFTQGVGLAWDGGYEGPLSDQWIANPGTADGGVVLYYSPQLPGVANSSFVQGAGFGVRNDAAGTWLSGGLGALRDADGDSRYEAGVFAQGTGYWQGTGLLLDGGGADAYEAYWYAQGGAAHYSIGALLDDGFGDDAYNPYFQAYNVHLGSGHDYSVGVLVDERGDDLYRSASLALGASNCQGIGLFVDNDGSDLYDAASTYGAGLGNHSTECEDASRTVGDSIGIFLDGGGDTDTWTWPDPTLRQPADDSTFGIAWTGAGDERGGAADGDGATALHASGTAPTP